MKNIADTILVKLNTNYEQFKKIISREKDMYSQLCKRNTIDENDVFSLRAGFRLKITQSTSIIADYFHSFWSTIPGREYFDPPGIGEEIETEGHVFSIMFTNASGILENDSLVNTVDDWA